MGDRADLIGAAGVGLGRGRGRPPAPRRGVAVDDVEAQQLLLGLGEGAVDHQRRVAALAQGGGGGGGQQAGDRPQPALLLGSLSCDFDPDGLHGLVVILLGPGADGVFGIVAKEGAVKYGGTLLGYCLGTKSEETGFDQPGRKNAPPCSTRWDSGRPCRRAGCDSGRPGFRPR